MSGNQGGDTRVTVTGRPEHAPDAMAIAALSAAVERAVEAHRPPGVRVREVVVMLEEGTGAGEPAPVLVDVYDSGYGHGI